MDAVNKTEQRNRLVLKRLEPEGARHHQLRKQACSEFEPCLAATSIQESRPLKAEAFGSSEPANFRDR